ncbi:hypothetical protein JQX13_24115 [Archangium violaceum]|uniref:hypothetical protein n=1 Tax=Archangium violaceum TaxID=83451 RepID=UPI00193AFBD9|nr:hypothetical protein [Archangium violaceum]QRK12845.1 hypothetical protein JQX13_24115 [Archangium violaceum]
MSDVERAVILGGLLLPSAIAGAGKGAARLSKALLRMENSLPAAASFANSLRGVIGRSDDALKKLASDGLGCAIP